MAQALLSELSKPKPPKLVTVTLEPDVWLERYFRPITAAQELIPLLPGRVPNGVGGYSFSGCCGARVITPESPMGNWMRRYIHVCVRMTVDEAMEKLQITTDFVRYYSIQYEGQWITFMWEDS